MSKSPIKDYTAILQQSRTRKKQELYPQKRQYQKYNNFLYKKTNDYSLDDAKIKLELALKHNTKLLDQNSTLSQMANSLRFQLRDAHQDIALLRRQHQDFLKTSSKQRQSLLMQTQIKQSTHQQELKRLLDQISTLHQQKNNIQIQKSKEIQKIKGQYQKSVLTQMQNLRGIQNNAKQLYQVQIRNLKQQLKKQQFDVDNIKSLQRLQKNRLKDQISSMQNQMKHLKLKYQIDLKETKRQFQKQVNSQKRRNQNERQLQSNNLNLKIKRLKKQLLDKAQDLQNVNKKMFHQQQGYQLQSLTFKKDKQNLLSQLTNNQVVYKTTLMKQKTKLQQLSRLEVQNLTNLYQTNIQQLQGQVNRLRLLIDCKTQQIKDSYEENIKIKLSFSQQIKLINNQNNLLKQRIKNIQLQYKQQQQTLKVKLSTLIQTNLQQIRSYYQNQLSNISIHNRQISNLNKDLKQRIYKSIQDNDDLRKTFQIQTSKYKARIQDLKIKLASISLQHKQHIGSLSSKVQMTSQTIIRQGQTKQRSKAFYQEQKRKFYALANQKDHQIQQMMQSLRSIKQMHQDQLKVVRTQRDSFRDQIQKLQLDKKRMKQSLQLQLSNKQQKLRSLKYDNQKEIQQIKQLQKKYDQTQKQKIKLQKKLDHVNLVNQSLAQQLGLKKGFIQTMQLQSNAAIQQEKHKIRVLMGSHEVTLKQYFQDKVKSKNQDIESLQKVLSQKEEDIRDLIIKYNALQKRFDIAMQAQQKLTEFEQKIKQLGLDNNLVKNMAELFKKKV